MIFSTSGRNENNDDSCRFNSMSCITFSASTGTAADIIEFFDSYKDNTIASERLLVYLTLGIWSWSLMQFTIVLSATRSRKPRGSGAAHQMDEYASTISFAFSLTSLIFLSSSEGQPLVAMDAAVPSTSGASR